MSISIKKYDKESLQNKFQKGLFSQADAFYLDKHFKIGSKYHVDKVKTLLLLNNVISNDNCEVQDFLDKKLRGALDSTNLEVVDLETVQTKYRDITNNYYTVNEPFKWSDEVIW